jgi:hypothetical protein
MPIHWKRSQPSAALIDVTRGSTASPVNTIIVQARMNTNARATGDDQL